ncbi:hypothetical protein, variant 2 [Verruconis gallopava]|uniref:Uncharacterized protein n=1 Tax=Verruconis gallopava TaxID=253628 RepID=A0A0D1YDP3_9PEZI|nr:hypothetical protein, variant 2 [Verruconis gallopava]KIV98856.1 hypothetical protein, variant 2 [Verruconis gallopava]
MITTFPTNLVRKKNGTQQRKSAGKNIVRKKETATTRLIHYVLQNGQIEKQKSLAKAEPVEILDAEPPISLWQKQIEEAFIGSNGQLSALTAGLYEPLRHSPTATQDLPGRIIEHTLGLLSDSTKALLHRWLWYQLLIYCRNLIELAHYDQARIVDLLRPEIPNIGLDYLRRLCNGAYYFREYIFKGLIRNGYPTMEVDLRIAFGGPRPYWYGNLTKPKAEKLSAQLPVTGDIRKGLLHFDTSVMLSHVQKWLQIECSFSALSRAFSEPSTLSPILELIDPPETRFFHYFCSFVVPTRSFSKHSIYSNMITLSEDSSYLRFTIHAVGAWYLKHPLALHYHTRCIRNFRLALSNLTRSSDTLKPLLSTQILLLQLAVIDPVLYNQWCMMVEASGELLRRSIKYPDTLDLRVKLASHHVLANTIEKKENAFTNHRFLEDWEEKVEEINETVAMSPQLLNMYQTVTILSFGTDRNNYEESRQAAMSILNSVSTIKQTCSNTTLTSDERQILEDTAELYRLGLRVYLDCRFTGLRSDVEIQDDLHNIQTIFCSQPTDGHLYKSVHSLWALFHLSILLGKIEPLVNSVEQLSNRPATVRFSDFVD